MLKAEQTKSKKAAATKMFYFGILFVSFAILFAIVSFWPIYSIPNRSETMGVVVNSYSKDGNTLCNDVSGDNGVVFKELICSRFLFWNVGDKVYVIHSKENINHNNFVVDNNSLIVAGILLLSALVSLGYLFVYHKRFSKDQKKRFTFITWISISIIAFSAITLIYGVYSLSRVPNPIIESATITKTAFYQDANLFCYDIETGSGKTISKFKCTDTLEASRWRITTYTFSNRVGRRIEPIHFDQNNSQNAYYLNAESSTQRFLFIYFLLGAGIMSYGISKKFWLKESDKLKKKSSK